MDIVAGIERATAVDHRQDQSIQELEWAVRWLVRGCIGLLVGLGLLGWWGVMKGCG